MRHFSLEPFLERIGSAHGYYASAIKHLHLLGGHWVSALDADNLKRLGALFKCMEHLETFFFTLSVDVNDGDEMSGFATKTWGFLVKSLIKDHRPLKKVLSSSTLDQAWDCHEAPETCDHGVTLVSERYRVRESETISDKITILAVPCDGLPCTIPQHMRTSLSRDPPVNFNLLY